MIQGAGGLGWWTHPRLGRIPPDTFIPLAEQTGVILPLTQWVLETALTQGRVWQQMGLALNLAVNLSMRTVHDSQFPHTVASLVRRYAMAPERATLEITESTLMADREGLAKALSRLTSMGVRLASSPLTDCQSPVYQDWPWCWHGLSPCDAPVSAQPRADVAAWLRPATPTRRVPWINGWYGTATCGSVHLPGPMYCGSGARSLHGPCPLQVRTCRLHICPTPARR